MSTKKSVKKAFTPAQKVEIGVGLTAAAVAAAGAYFLYGSKNADKNRKAVKSWALKAKAEVLEKIEGAKQMSREEYQDIVAAATAAYAGAKSATKKDLKEFSSEMMGHWEALEKSVSKAKKATKKVATKATKTTKNVTKTANKTAKKATKKVAKK